MTRKQIDSKWRATALILTALPAVFLLALGCEPSDGPVTEDVGKGEAVAPEATPAGEDALNERRTGKRFRDGHHGRKGHHKGHRSPAAMLLRSALRELDLTDEQRAELQALRPEKGAHKGEGHGKGKAGFHEALVQALETGELDRTAFTDKLESKKSLFEKKFAQRNERLATLHRILTPEQRKQLVEGIRARMDEKRAKHAEKAEGEWQGHHGKRGGRGMLGKLTSGLDLTDEQQAQVDALIAKAEEQRPSAEQWAEKKQEKHARIGAMLDAFTGDDFDPATSVPKPEPIKDPAAKLAFKADQIEALIGILTTEQRAQLAERIKNRKMGHGKMGHGKMGHGGPGCGGAGDCPFGGDDF
jgi:Spy/CpxP family protein refolding chaperone